VGKAEIAASLEVVAGEASVVDYSLLGV